MSRERQAGLQETDWQSGPLTIGRWATGRMFARQGTPGAIDSPAEMIEVVPRSDAEALAHAVSASLTHGEESPLVEALRVYLSKHPWSDL